MYGRAVCIVALLFVLTGYENKATSNIHHAEFVPAYVKCQCPALALETGRECKMVYKNEAPSNSNETCLCAYDNHTGDAWPCHPQRSWDHTFCDTCNEHGYCPVNGARTETTSCICQEWTNFCIANKKLSVLKLWEYLNPDLHTTDSSATNDTAEKVNEDHKEHGTTASAINTSTQLPSLATVTVQLTVTSPPEEETSTSAPAVQTTSGSKVIGLMQNENNNGSNENTSGNTESDVGKRSTEVSPIDAESIITTDKNSQNDSDATPEQNDTGSENVKTQRENQTDKAMNDDSQSSEFPKLPVSVTVNAGGLKPRYSPVDLIGLLLTLALMAYFVSL